MNRLLLYSFLIIFIQSCTNIINRQVTNKLEHGLTKTEVTDIIGSKPAETKYFSNSEIMVYYIHSAIFDLIFSKNFPYFGFYPFNSTGDEFWIVLKNNRVSSFGYAKNYGYSFNNIKD